LAETRLEGLETELEDCARERGADQSAIQDLEKRLDRQKRQTCLLRQEHKATVAQKDLQISSLHTAQENEKRLTQLRLQKGKVQSRVLQKKLETNVVSNDSEVARLDEMSNVKSQLERKIAILEKDQRRTNAMYIQKTKDMTTLQREHDALKKQVERATPKKKRFTPQKRKNGEDLDEEEEEEFEKLREELEGIERENEILLFECERDEVTQQLVTREMDILRDEIRRISV